MRIGFGYDAHRLVPGRKLVLGGVCIPYSQGLLGHSDADVLVHAIMDALLGAAALGDIGRHFPDTEERYKDASSLLLLTDVAYKIKQEGYTVGNIDAVVIAEAPKLAPYIDRMVDNIAKTLAIDLHCINVKATTEEGLGFTGNAEGISAKAVCLLEGNTSQTQLNKK